MISFWAYSFRKKFLDLISPKPLCKFSFEHIFHVCFLFSFFLTSGNLLAQTESQTLKDAKQAYSQKNYAKAVELFQAYSTSNPSDGIPHMYVGYIHESRKNFPKAASSFRKAVDLNLPKDKKQTCLLKLAVYFQSSGDYDLANIYANRYLKTNPNDREMIKLRDKAESLKSGIARPLEVKESDGDDEPEEKPNSEFEKAVSLMQKEEYDKAEPILISLSKKESNNPEIFYKLGLLNLRKNKLDSAHEYFEKALAKTKESQTSLLYFLHLNQGIAFQKQKNFPSALESFRKSLSYQKKPAPYLALARIKWEVSDFASCLKYAKKAEELEADQLDSLVLESVCLQDMGEREKGNVAILQFEKNLLAKYKDYSQTPTKYFEGLLKLATFHVNNQEYSTSEKIYQTIEKNYLDDREYLFYRGKSYLYQNKTREAIAHLGRVGNSPTAHYLLAKCYALENRESNMRTHLEKAGEEKPAFYLSALEDPEFANFQKDPRFVASMKEKHKIAEQKQK